MAIVWQKNVGDRSYQLRQSGASLRLYTNGVFHSQYNDSYPLSGSVWDLLALPALMLPMQSIFRVLVLGVGAGAVIRVLQKLVQPQLVIGIDLDNIHLFLARKYFAVRKRSDVALHCVNAVDWLQVYRGPKFDLIVEDLFIESKGQPQRAVVADHQWCQLLLRNLSAQGVLVMNFDSRKVLKNCGLSQQKSLRTQYSSSYLLNAPGYDNCIGAFFRKGVDKKQLQNNLLKLKKCHGSTLTQRFNAKIRRLDFSA